MGSAPARTRRNSDQQFSDFKQPRRCGQGVFLTGDGPSVIGETTLRPFSICPSSSSRHSISAGPLPLIPDFTSGARVDQEGPQHRGQYAVLESRLAARQ
jgi:hypothetical protein